MGNMWRLPGAERGGESERGGAANIPVRPAAPPQPSPHRSPLRTAAAGLPPAPHTLVGGGGMVGAAYPAVGGCLGGAGGPRCGGGLDRVRAESRRRECPPRVTGHVAPCGAEGRSRTPVVWGRSCGVCPAPPAPGIAHRG